jgi:hypothetical protein
MEGNCKKDQADQRSSGVLPDCKLVTAARRR